MITARIDTELQPYWPYVNWSPVSLQPDQALMLKETENWPMYKGSIGHKTVTSSFPYIIYSPEYGILWRGFSFKDGLTILKTLKRENKEITIQLYKWQEAKWIIVF